MVGAEPCSESLIPCTWARPLKSSLGEVSGWPVTLGLVPFREIEGMEPHLVRHRRAPLQYLQLPSVTLSDAGALGPCAGAPQGCSVSTPDRGS